MHEDTASASQTANKPIEMIAADGYSLGGFIWHHGAEGQGKPVVVISSATSVKCRYYSRFADYLFSNGFNVITYDYRGIGQSRPKRLRGFKAGWAEWGELDLEAALRYAQVTFPASALHVVAHSIGGFAIGLAPSNDQITRIFTFGSQFAHWRDYAATQRKRMFVKWHVAMPLLTRLFGYFPAKRLGWMEDTPAGVGLDWSGMGERFEETMRLADPAGARLRFQQVKAPILAVGLDDDPHGTAEALDRLLAYFTTSHRRHWRIEPSDIGVEAIGHFAFFHDRFKQSLWPLAVEWLRTGKIVENAPGRLHREVIPAEGRSSEFTKSLKAPQNA